MCTGIDFGGRVKNHCKSKVAGFENEIPVIDWKNWMYLIWRNYLLGLGQGKIFQLEQSQIIMIQTAIPFMVNNRILQVDQHFKKVIELNLQKECATHNREIEYKVLNWFRSFEIGYETFWLKTINFPMEREEAIRYVIGALPEWLPWNPVSKVKLCDTSKATGSRGPIQGKVFPWLISLINCSGPSCLRATTQCYVRFQQPRELCLQSKVWTLIISGDSDGGNLVLEESIDIF